MINCDLSTVLNLVGLCIDIVGALLMFFNSPRITYKTHLYKKEEEEKLEKKAKRMHRRTQMGALLLVIGFLFQIAGNLFK